MTLPTVLTAAGLQPQSPATLRAELIALVTATNPGYTANLPGSLIEDISSTDVGAMTLIDSARVDLVNSLTPYGANAFLLNQLGQVYGVQKGIGSNTSVYVRFSGSPGYVVARGFVVSDGGHQYIVQDGGVIASGGTSDLLYCIATQSGSWAVPIGTVTQLVTSVPTGVILSVSNPVAGLPGATAQSEEEYRAQVLQAGLSSASGMAAFMKTQLGKVSGVQPRLVSVRQLSGQWEIIVGGGDPYEVANAIYTGLFDVSNLVGSTIAVSNITNAANGVVTTNINHGYVTGQVVYMNGIVGMPLLNSLGFTVTVLSKNSFSIGVNTTSLGTYTSGGVCTPNSRNVLVSINDYPDTYSIPIVIPPQQVTGVFVTWNTTSTNYVSATAVAQLAQPALIAYVNSIPVGAPINVFELQATFQNSIASIVPHQLISRMIFTVTIDGTTVAPSSGTGLIYGDPESYFQASTTSVIINQG